MRGSRKIWSARYGFLRSARWRRLQGVRVGLLVLEPRRGRQGRLLTQAVAIAAHRFLVVHLNKLVEVGKGLRQPFCKLPSSGPGCGSPGLLRPGKPGMSVPPRRDPDPPPERPFVSHGLDASVSRRGREWPCLRPTVHRIGCRLALTRILCGETIAVWASNLRPMLSRKSPSLSS